MRLHCDDVSFAWAGKSPVLDGVSFVATPGFIAVVGANGCGKTTLLRLVEGSLEPTSGKVRIDGAARVRLCAQSDAQMPEDAHRLAGETSRVATRLRAQLGLSPDQLGRWASLSGGERRRWHLGAALLEDPDVLLLDEPTNHLDGATRALLIETLKRWRGIGVLVSHDRELIDALATQVVRLRDGRAEVYAGGFSTAQERWEVEERALHEKREALREQERAAARRLESARRQHAAVERERSVSARSKGPADSDARGIHAQFRVDRAAAGAGKAVHRSRDALEAVALERRSLPVAHVPTGRLAVGWEPCPRRWIFNERHELRVGQRTADDARDVFVQLGRAGRMRISGPNGAGKTTLLEALAAACPLPRERVLVLPQNLDEGADLVQLARLRGLQSDARARCLQVYGALDANPGRLLEARSLSPGETRKLMISLSFSENVWLLLLDEPTNHLDLFGVLALERALAQWPGALVLVSHDERFAASVVGAGETLSLAPRPRVGMASTGD